MRWLAISEYLRRRRLGFVVVFVETIRAMAATPVREWPALWRAMVGGER